MCVQDYLTWATIKKNFEVKVSIEQARTGAEEAERLGMMEQDKQLISEAEHHLTKVSSIGEMLNANIERVMQQDVVIRERIYAEGLQQHMSDVNMIKHIQGVDLRANLAKLLAVSKVLETTHDALEELKEWDGNSESKQNTDPSKDK